MKWMAHDITRTSPFFLSLTTMLLVYLDLALIWLMSEQLIDSAKEHNLSRKIVLDFALVLHY